MIIDSHVHLFTGPRRKLNCSLPERAGRSGISRIAVSSLGREKYLPSPSEEEVSEANSDVLSLMKNNPGSVCGLCYTNPLNNNCVEEAERRAGEGFTGIKLWLAAKCGSPEVFHVVEAAIRLKMLVLIHSFMRTGGNLENESSPLDVALLAGKYPEAMIIMAHASANGSAGLERVRGTPNVLVDTSGGYPERGTVEKAVEILGEGRVLFGSDAPGRSFRVQLANVCSAGIRLSQKRLVLGGNFLRITGA